MDYGREIFLGILLLAAYGVSYAIIKGHYFPLRKEYPGWPERTLFQQRYGVLFALLCTVGFLREVIFVNLENPLYHKGSYWVLLLLFVAFIANVRRFIKGKRKAVGAST